MSAKIGMRAFIYRTSYLKPRTSKRLAYPRWIWDKKTSQGLKLRGLLVNNWLKVIELSVVILR